MAKKRSLLQVLIALLLVLGFITGPQAAKAQGGSQARRPAGALGQEIPATYELVGENDNFQLYANRSSLAFKVVDRRSGYVWHSNLDEKIDGDRLNRTWMAFASSGISIDYLDEKAGSERLSITNSEPVIQFNPTGQGFEAQVTFPDPSITLLLRVTLEDAGVGVEIPFDGIQEADAAFKLGQVYVYPFLGYTREAVTPGYMFIPDGSGSLIRFAETTKATNMYYGRYYGTDLGMLAEMPYDPTINRPMRISVPVYGMVHGEKEHGYIAVVEKGASYGELQAHPAGIITNFNFIYNMFVYNQSYFQATNRSGAGVTTVQQNTNDFDVKIHYRFLTGEDSDYVGMARSYQKYLVEQGQLKKVDEAGGDIGIKLEFLGGEKEKVLFWWRLIPMTTVEQMAAILEALQVRNPDVVYYGWQPLGASSMPPTSLKIDRGLGSLEQLRELAEKVQSQGGNFALYLNPQAALYQEGGYSPRYDLAMAITNVNMIGYNRYTVNYYLNFDAINQRFSRLNADVVSELNAGLALDGIGTTLYSDFKAGNFLNREQAIARYRSLMEANPGSKAFYMPNDYLFGYMDAYYDMPLSNNGYIYTSESVPFLQIVLSGYVPYYGPAMNFSSDPQTDLLRHVDYGVYPSFFLTQEVTGKIINTRSSWLYTSSYDQWGDDINQTYQRLNALLGPVKGQSIVAREELAAGVVAVTYENGKQILVNYTDQPYNAGETVVNAKDAIIREVVP
ncbi:MAG: hypothetical protein GYA20_10410 [Chloroflexi bacterium]|nr:hypothetical protein [Chloroflexota bacterium]